MNGNSSAGVHGQRRKDVPGGNNESYASHIGEQPGSAKLIKGLKDTIAAAIGKGTRTGKVNDKGSGRGSCSSNQRSPRSTAPSASFAGCWHCGKPGHLRRECSTFVALEKHGKPLPGYEREYGKQRGLRRESHDAESENAAQASRTSDVKAVLEERHCEEEGSDDEERILNGGACLIPAATTGKEDLGEKSVSHETLATHPKHFSSDATVASQKVSRRAANRLRARQ